MHKRNARNPHSCWVSSPSGSTNGETDSSKNGSVPPPNVGLGSPVSFSWEQALARSSSFLWEYGLYNHTRLPIPEPSDNRSLCPSRGFVVGPPSAWDVRWEYSPVSSRPTSCPAYWHRSPRCPTAHPPHRSTRSVSSLFWPDPWDSFPLPRLPAELWSWTRPSLATPTEFPEVDRIPARHLFRDGERHPALPIFENNDGGSFLTQTPSE